MSADKTDWGSFTDWGMVLPPNRPTSGFLRRLDSIASAIPRDLPVAVLGSTPEIRDIYARLQFRNICVIDRSDKSYSLMAALMPLESTETFLHGDWSDVLRERRGEFALIASDLTLGNIPYERTADFLQAVADALHPEGLYLDRFLLHTRHFKKLEELDAWYATAPFNLLQLNFFSSDYLFLSELVRDHGGVDSSLFFDLLERRFVDRRLQYFLRQVYKITPRGGRWWYGRDEIVSNAYDGAFRTVMDMADDADGTPYEGYTRIRLSRRRGLY